MLIRNAEIWRRGAADVRIAGARIAAIGQLEPEPGEAVIDAGGGLLLPGLHDHHLHLCGLAARQASVWCGPPGVTDRAALAAALSRPGQGWVRGIGYHESVMGLPSARELDLFVADRPLRIQHRSGRLWLLNSLALEVLVAAAPAPSGFDTATGHLFDEDRWLQQALGSSPPDLAEVGSALAAWGITGITDMSAANGTQMAAHFAHQLESGRLPQHVVLAGTLELGESPSGPWRLGSAKLHLHEAALPDFDRTVAFIAAAHERERAVAIHCVSEVELVFAIAAIEQARTRRGDRVEHAAVASDELVQRIAALGLAVVAQPLFVKERGDAYLRDVEPRHHGELYRLRAFHDAGVTLAAGSDAPFGDANPWAAMAAAVERTTADGAEFGPDEALTAEQALSLFLADPLDLTTDRRLAKGEAADLCLLDRTWDKARLDLASVEVRATWISGRLIHDRVDEAPA